MKVYSIVRSDKNGAYATYFGIVTEKRTGFTNENLACVRTYIEHEGAPRYVPELPLPLVGGGIMNIATARGVWHNLLKPSYGMAIVSNSEYHEVFKSNGKEPMMDSEIINEMDTHAEWDLAERSEL